MNEPARAALLPWHPVLAGTARLPALADRPDVQWVELFALLLTGAATALLSTFLNFRLGIPGHHIVYSMFPMALGFALVPRRRAGTVMGGSAVGSTALLALAGAHVPGPGALTSLALTGPLLDAALHRGGRGWRLYALFVAAGALSNAAAFGVRAAMKALGFAGQGGGRPMASWLPQAVWTYAIAGVLAGLISAAAWFHVRERRPGT